MKKVSVLILVLSLVLISGSAFADSHMDMAKGTWYVGADYDMGGNFNMTDGTDELDYDVESGFSINGEYIMPYKNKMSIGGGLTYQLSRTFTDYPNAEMNFIPVYGLVKYDLQDEAYVVGHLGYNMFNGNEEFKEGAELGGGIYYAAGFGFTRDMFNGELIYTVNNGTFDELDVTYSKLSLSFGYKF